MRPAPSNKLGLIRRLSFYLLGLAAGLMILGLFKQLRRAEQFRQDRPATSSVQPPPSDK